MPARSASVPAQKLLSSLLKEFDNSAPIEQVKPADIPYELEDLTLIADVPFPRQFQIPRYLDVRNVVVEGALYLNGAHFPFGASFVGVTFRDEADFSNCTFDDHAYFWRCRFASKVTFESLQTTCKRAHKSIRIPGEGNFSYCTFDEEAEFARATFDGPCYLYRPVFRKGVSFEGSIFHDKLVLAGSSKDVCLAYADLPQTSISALLRAKVIKRSRDHAPYCDVKLDRCPPEEVETQIRDRLEAVGHSTAAGDAKVVAALWHEQFSLSTFSPDHDVDFRNVTLEEDSPFRHVDLRRCLLQDTSVGNIDFIGVTWPREDRTFLGISTLSRQRVYDESVALLDSQAAVENALLHDLSNLYHRLMLRHELKGDRESARDFYYGEMEMLRLSSGRARIFSLANIYRVASGYSKQEGRALAWLLLLVVVIAPLLFGWNSYRNDSRFRQLRPRHKWVTRSMLYSLEASTFLNRPGGSDSNDSDDLGDFPPAVAKPQTASEAPQVTAPAAGPTNGVYINPLNCTTGTAANDISPYCAGKLSRRRRLIEALERLFVAFQAALFLIAIKSRFKGPST